MVSLADQLDLMTQPHPQAASSIYQQQQLSAPHPQIPAVSVATLQTDSSICCPTDSIQVLPTTTTASPVHNKKTAVSNHWNGSALASTTVAAAAVTT